MILARRLTRWLIRTAAPAALFCCAANIRAETPSSPNALAHLDWSRSGRAEQCLSGQALEQGVERRLGRKVFVPETEAELMVMGEAFHRAGQWQVKLTLTTRSGALIGKRQVATRAAHCSSLDEAVSLIVALSVDVPRETLTQHEPATQQASTPIEIPEDAPAPRQRKQWRASVSADANLAGGMLPGTAVGVGASVALRAPYSWLFVVGGTEWFARREGTTSGGDFTFRSLTVALCPWHWGDSAWVCASQRVGRVRAEGFGFDEVESAERTIVAPGISIRGDHWLTRWLYLAATVTAEVPLVAHRYFYSDTEEATIYDMSPVIGVGTLSLGVSP